MLTRRRRRGEQGQVIVFTALTFLFVLSILIAAVGDLLVLGNESAKARDAAFLAATAGGADVDISSTASSDLTQTSNLRLASNAVHDCEQAAGIADPGVTVTCTVSGGRIAVSVSKSVTLPIQVFGASATVRAQAQGGPAAGTVTAH